MHSAAAQAQAEPVELSATEAAAQIRDGTLKSEDLVRALADAMERKRDLNSFVSFDREAALNAAREADAAAKVPRRKGLSRQAARQTARPCCGSDQPSRATCLLRSPGMRQHGAPWSRSW